MEVKVSVAAIVYGGGKGIRGGFLRDLNYVDFFYCGGCKAAAKMRNTEDFHGSIARLLIGQVVGACRQSRKVILSGGISSIGELQATACDCDDCTALVVEWHRKFIVKVELTCYGPGITG